MKPLVFSYYLKPPTKNADLVMKHFELLKRLNNRYVEIEITRRNAVRQALEQKDLLISEVVDEHQRCSDLYDAQYKMIKEYKGATKSAKVPPEMREQLKQLKEERDAAYRIVKVRRAELKGDKTCANTIAEANLQAQEEIKRVRSISGVPWGTYNRLEQFRSASNNKLPLWKYIKGEGIVTCNPKKDYEFDLGFVTHQIKRPEMTQADLLAGDDNWIRLKLHGNKFCNEDSPENSSNRSRRRNFGVFSIRIGSEGRTPIFAEFPMLMHRPLPEGAFITGVTVSKWRQGPANESWRLYLTVDVPNDYQRPRVSKGTVAVDLGWRHRGDNGLRVAYCVDDKGNAEEILTDKIVLEGLREADSLKSIRDNSKKLLNDQLRSWVKSQDAPPWMKLEYTHMHLWKSSKRYYRLLNQWSDNRWEGDNEGFVLLETFVKDDKHLWEMFTNVKNKAYSRRAYSYRAIAARLASKYDNLILEDFDLSKVQKNDDDELPKTNKNKKVKNPTAKRQQVDVAASIFRRFLIEAFVVRGGQEYKVEPSMTTQIHAACGSEERWDAAPQIEHFCTCCRQYFDQDHNACENLLKRWKDGDYTKGTAGVRGPSRWKKLKALKSEKAAKEANAAA